MRTPARGDVVDYRLTADDVMSIGDARHAAPGSRSCTAAGNLPAVGETVPMLVVKVWPDEYGPDVPGVNGQAFLDGNDSLWVTSAREGAEPGQWAWRSTPAATPSAH